MKRIPVVLCAAMVGSTLHAGAARALEPEPRPEALDAALLEADRRFVAGDLAGALEILEPACSGSERPECLFSLAAVQHGLGHCVDALRHYRRYREVAPQGDQIAEVTAALEEVEGRCGDEPAQPSAGGVPRGSAAAPDGSAPGPAETRAVVDRSVSAVTIGAAAITAEPGTSASPSATGSARSINEDVMLGSLALSGATAVGSVVFGVLAARSARRCDRAQVYDAAYVDECEQNGPLYQGLWQGFALASASFLGIGLTLWWLDPGSTATLGVSGSGSGTLTYRRTF